jgi:hypothetical protein
MNQLKRWSSLKRKGVDHDTASMAPGVWDLVVGRWDSMDRSMAALGCSAVKITPSKCVLHPSYAVENRMVMTKLAV